MKIKISCLTIDGKPNTNPNRIANEFNNFFSTIAKKLEQKLIPTDKNFKNYLPPQNKKTFFVQPTDPKEVSLLINSLNPKIYRTK